MSEPSKNRLQYLSVPEAARVCGVSRSTMYTWVKTGTIDASQTPGKTNRIDPKELIRFMNENGMHVDPWLTKQSRHAHEADQGQNGGTSANQILVVDDDARNRELIQRALPDFSIIEAETGFEALHLVTKNHQIDLILLDMRMPGQHGLQTLKEVKKMTPDTPVVVITAYAGEVPTSLILNGMVAEIIEKPFSKNELTFAVEKELARS